MIQKPRTEKHNTDNDDLESLNPMVDINDITELS